MSFWVRTNQRRAIRRAYLLPCTVLRQDDFMPVGEFALDLSQDGMLVMTDSDAERGQELLVSFQATDLNLWFHAEARIARVIEGRRPGDRGRCLGVEFTSLDPVKRHILQGSLRRVPPPVPRRPQRIDYVATLRRLLAEPAPSSRMERAA
jgi:hypothetical protein